MPQGSNQNNQNQNNQNQNNGQANAIPVLDANYVDNLNQIIESQQNPIKGIIDALGPKGKLTKDLDNAPEYDAEAFKDDDIPEGLDTEFVTAVILGAMLDPARLNRKLTESTVVGTDYVTFNQSYIFSNIAYGNAHGGRDFIPVLAAARREAKTALVEYRKGNYGPVKQMLDRFIDFSDSNMRDIGAMTNPRSHVSRIYGPERVFPLLAGKVRGKAPVNANGSSTRFEIAKQTAFNKVYAATGRAASLRVEMINGAGNLSVQEKENKVFELLFNIHISAVRGASIGRRDKSVDMVFADIQKKFGIVKQSTDSSSLTIDIEASKVVSDLRRIYDTTKIDEFEAYLADENGIEKLKAIYGNAIKNSDAFKALINANTDVEMCEAIRKVENKIFSNALVGRKNYEVTLPDEAGKYNSLESIRYEQSLNRIKDAYEKALDQYYSRDEQYERYKLTDLSENSIRQNAENLNRLYRLVDENEPFVWFGSGDTAYAEIKAAVNALSNFAKELGNPENPIDSRKISHYIKLAKRVEDLSGQYLVAWNGNNETDKIRAIINVKRIVSVNRLSVEEAQKNHLLSDAERFGARQILENNNKRSRIGFDETIKVFRGNNYRNTVLSDSAQGLRLGRMSGVTIAITVLANTGKYSFEDLFDNTKLVFEKQRVYDEIIRRGKNGTPENRKWFAEQLYMGMKTLTDMIDQKSIGIDYNDPNLESTDAYQLIEWAAQVRFDIWQEAKHCDPEIVELAKKEDPQINNYEDYKNRESRKTGLTYIARSTKFAGDLERYLSMDIKDNIGVLIGSAFDYYKCKELLLPHLQAHKGEKRSETVDGVIDYTFNMVLPNAKAEGLSEIENILEANKNIEKALMPKIVDGSLFKDIVMTLDREHEEIIYDGIKDLVELLKTKNVNYILQKLEDKSYLKRNTLDARLADTREERVNLFKKEGSAQLREILELNEEELAKAVELFDKTFGPHLDKAEIKNYLAEEAGRNMVDLFYVNGKSLRTYIGKNAVEHFISNGNMNVIKATIIRLATDPAVELKTVDLNYNLKTDKNDYEIKTVIDRADKELIINQVPYMTSLDTFKKYTLEDMKAQAKRQNVELDTRGFSDTYWNNLYEHEFSKIAADGLVPADRIVTLEDMKRNTNPILPQEELVKEIETLFGPKQKFIKEWAGKKDGKTQQSVSRDTFVKNMKDVDPGSFSSSDFATLAFFVSMDKSVIPEVASVEYTGNGIPKEDFVEYNTSKWTSDFWAGGIGMPRINMGKKYLPQFNYARTATSQKIQQLQANDAKPLADSIVTGIRRTLQNVRVLQDISDNKKDAGCYMHMLSVLTDVIAKNNTLSKVIDEQLTAEESKELHMLLQLKKVMDNKEIASDTLLKAERGEVELSPEQRQNCIEKMAAGERYAKAWSENHKTFMSSDGYKTEFEKVMAVYRSPEYLQDNNVGLKADIEFIKYLKNAKKHDQQMVEALTGNDPQGFGKDLVDELNSIKEQFKVRSENYKDICDRYRAKSDAPIGDGEILNERVDLYHERYICYDGFIQFANALSDALSMDQVNSIARRFDVIAGEKGWTRMRENFVSKITPFSLALSTEFSKEKRDTFFGLVFEEFEKSPILISGIQDKINQIKTLDQLTAEEKVVYPENAKINTLINIGVTDDIRVVLERVKKNLAEVKTEVSKQFDDYERRVELFNKLRDKAEGGREQLIGQKPEISQNVKQFVTDTAAKLQQMGLITGYADAEQGVKVYAHHKLMDAKNNLKVAVKTGNLETIVSANTAFEAEQAKMRELFAFVKEYIGDTRLAPNNLDTLRNPEIPTMFSHDYATDSTVNGIYSLMEQCTKMGVTIEQYMNDPFKTVNDFVENGVIQKGTAQYAKPEMTFAESLYGLFKAGEKEVDNPRFQREVVGGAVSMTIGRTFDTLCMLEKDPAKLLTLEKHKFNLTSAIESKLTDEGIQLENVYRITGNQSRIRSDKLKVYKEGLKAAFVSGGPLKREYIRIIYKNGRAELTGQDSDYLNMLKVKDRYAEIKDTAERNIAKIAEIEAEMTAGNRPLNSEQKTLLNDSKMAVIEAMIDYLMEHPEDRMKPEYKNFMKAAKTASTNYGFEVPNPDGPITPYEKYKKWQEDFKKEVNELSKAAKTTDKEFDEKLKELQKRYNRADQHGKLDIQQEIRATVNGRIHELIDDYKCKEITESYLKARYEALNAFSVNPEMKLPELPAFIDESSPEKAEKDLALINDRVHKRAWEGHLADIDSYAAWRMNHVAKINENGEVEIREEQNMEVNDISAEDWMLAWKNDIRRTYENAPVPEGIVDPLDLNYNVDLAEEDRRRQEENHRILEDEMVGGLLKENEERRAHNNVNPPLTPEAARNNLRRNLEKYAAHMDEVDQYNKSYEDIITLSIARDVSTEITTRRQEIPMGLSYGDFVYRLSTDPVFKRVIKPILEEIKTEATAENRQEGPLNSVNMLFEMLDNHAIISAAAMEQKAAAKAKQEGVEQTQHPGVSHIMKEIAKHKRELEQANANNINNANNGPHM